MTSDIIKEIFSVVLSTGYTVILAIVAAFIIYGIKLLCNKFGITVNSETMSDIITIITQVIKYLDQKFVDNIKKNSTDGTLTNYQKEMIKNKCVSMIKSILNSEQVDFLLRKYNMENIDDILDILIESTIKDARNNNEETIIINDNQNTNSQSEEKVSTVAVTYNPTAEEIASINKCPGNCKVCTLADECNICRSDYIF